MQRLVSAFVIARLNYCNSVLAGLHMFMWAPLQHVLFAAVRLVASLGPCNYVPAHMKRLHWLQFVWLQVWSLVIMCLCIWNAFTCYTSSGCKSEALWLLPVHMKRLHWLPITYRIKFKLYTLMHGAVHRQILAYIKDVLVPIWFFQDILDFNILHRDNQSINQSRRTSKAPYVAEPFVGAVVPV